jgi:heme exporter protein A
LTLDAPAVAATRLSRRYGRRWALAEVSFSIPPSCVVLVTGHNGAGKSTLLRVLATAARPDAGEARVAGRDIRHERDEVRRRSVLLDHRAHLYSALTARENLEVARRHLGSHAGPAPVAEVLDRVGLGPRAGDGVGTFSAGMRKRLSLARLLLQEPAVVFLDEPYGELDPAGFALVDALLADWRARGATVLLSTHLLDRGRALGDHALVLEGGRLVWEGEAKVLPPQGAHP